MAGDRRGLTLEEFLELPEEKPALEYFDGVVTQKVASGRKHSLLKATLVTWINTEAEPRKLAIAFPGLRTTYQGASLVPDISVFRWDRIPLDADGELEDDCYDPPDVAIEIRTPGQPRGRQLRRRCEWFVANGVPLVLLVEPRTVCQFTPVSPPLVLRDMDVVDLGIVVPGLNFTVYDLFRALRLR